MADGKDSPERAVRGLRAAAVGEFRPGRRGCTRPRPARARASSATAAAGELGPGQRGAGEDGEGAGSGRGQRDLRSEES